jgi:hypothetical protein
MGRTVCFVYKLNKNLSHADARNEFAIQNCAAELAPKIFKLCVRILARNTICIAVRDNQRRQNMMQMVCGQIYDRIRCSRGTPIGTLVYCRTMCSNQSKIKLSSEGSSQYWINLMRKQTINRGKLQTCWTLMVNGLGRSA